MNWWKVGAAIFVGYLFVAGMPFGIWNAVRVAGLGFVFFMLGYYAKENEAAK